MFKNELPGQGIQVFRRLLLDGYRVYISAEDRFFTRDSARFSDIHLPVKIQDVRLKTADMME